MSILSTRLKYAAVISFLGIFGCLAQDSLLTGGIPAEILFRKPLFSDYCISPDGKYFAETIKNNHETDLIIVDIDAYKMQERIPLGNIRIQELYWLNPKRLLYEAEGEIFAIDTDGANKTLIVNRLPDRPFRNWSTIYKNFRYNNVLSILPSKKDEILIETFDYEAYATAKRVNIFTGEKYVVASGKHHKINKWMADLNGIIKLGIRYDDTGFYFLDYDAPNDSWRPLNIYLNGNEYPLKISAGSYLDQNLNFEGFDSESDVIYLSSNIDSDRRNLIKYHLKERKLIETLIEDVNCDISDPHGEEISIIHDPKNASLAGFRYEGLVPEFKWYSSEFETAHQILNGKYRLLVHDIIATDNANQRFLVHQWSDSYAGNIGVFNVADSTYAVMHQLNEELNSYRLSRTRNIVVPTRDNYKVPAYLNFPPEHEAGIKVPLVVLPHGGPWTRDYWELDQFAQYFTSRGYATLKVNFRGSTGLGKEHVLAGIRGISSVMIDDLADAVTHVSGNYSVDASRVYLYGHSYGGYATYMSLIRYPQLYASGVAVSAPSDIKSWMKFQKKENNDFAYEFWKVALGTRSNDYFSEISPVNKAEQLNRPILIAHGGQDEIIPVEQANNMVAQLRADGKEVESKIFKNEGHSFQDSNNMGYLLDLAHEFFQGTNPEQSISGR